MVAQDLAADVAVVVAAEAQMVEMEIKETREKRILLVGTEDLAEVIRTVQEAAAVIKEPVQTETAMVVAVAGPDSMIDQVHCHGQEEMAQKDLLEFPV